MTNQELGYQKIENAKKLTDLANKELSEGLALLAAPAKKEKKQMYEFSEENMRRNIKTGRI